ncbi:MAG: hypothetical protein ABSE73_19580, partial [Planctomycetota bacterium]
MSRSIALLLLILAGVAGLAPAVPAAEEKTPVFLPPEEGLPVSAQGRQTPAPEKKAQAAAETPAAVKKTEEEPMPVADKGAGEAADKKAPAPVEEPLAAKEISPPPVPENEQKLHDMVKQAAAGTDAKTARKSLVGRTARTISAPLAVLKGIERNLTIQSQGKTEDITRFAIQEAKAVYDPVFTVTGTWAAHTQYNRSAVVPTFNRPTVQTTDANGNVINVLDMTGQATPKFPMQQIVFSSPRPAGIVMKRQVASETLANGPLQTNTGRLEIDQQLPWGPSVFITLASQEQAQFFDDGPNPALNQQIQALNTVLADPTKSADDKAAASALQQQLISLYKQSYQKGENYGRPWSSSAVLGGVIPVPCFKDWGKYAGAEVGLKLAELSNDSAFWDTKNVISLTLLQVDHAYWDLAGTLEGLRAATENRR